MNYQDTNKFLNFVQSIMPKEYLAIYYSRQSDGNDYYYFHTGLNCELRLRSTGNDINFLFKTGIEGVYKETNDMSVNISFEDAKPILEQCFKAWQKRKMDDFLYHNNLTVADVKKDLDFINSYLEVTDLSKKFKVQQETVNLVLKSPDGAKYEVRAGSLYKERPERKNILHICEIPVILHGRGHKGHIYLEHVIPGWDIANYNGLKSVLSVDSGVTSLQDLSEKIKKINPEVGAFFLASILSQELPQKQSKVKLIKI